MQETLRNFLYLINDVYYYSLLTLNEVIWSHTGVTGTILWLHYVKLILFKMRSNFYFQKVT